MNHCETCKHWHRQEKENDCDVFDFDRAENNALCGVGQLGWCGFSPKFTPWKKWNGDLSAVMYDYDTNDTLSEIITGPKYGCVHWEDNRGL